MLFCKGSHYEISQTPDAKSSWEEATGHAKEACIAQLVNLIKRLSDIGKLNSPDQFNHEGDGIFAIKARCGLRAYGWFHAHRRGVFMISHFRYKNWQKLDPADLRRAKKNRKLFDVD